MASPGSAVAQYYSPPRYYPSTVPARPVPQPQVQLNITFGGRTHAERLANNLVTQANNICLQMDREFKGNRNYRETYRAMYTVLVDAKEIRDQVARGTHRKARRDDDEIATALHHMDREFHNIDAELRTWRADVGRQSRQDVAQLASLVDQFEETLHHMMDDYGVRTRRNVPQAQPRPQVQPGRPGPVQAPQPGYPYRDRR